jgi:P4 family phage/plasmid primase-like protien
MTASVQAPPSAPKKTSDPKAPSQDQTSPAKQATGSPRGALVLRALDGHKCRKVLRHPSGEVQSSYDKATWFEASEVEFGSAEQIWKHLRILSRDERACVVRASLSPGVGGARVMRRHQQEPRHLRACARAWVALDVDGAVAPLEVANLGREAMRDWLCEGWVPAPFAGARCVVQWSSRQHPSFMGAVYARLWYVLSEPVEDQLLASALRHFKEQDAQQEPGARRLGCLDAALCRNIQIHYTAAPLWLDKDGHSVPDPLNARIELWPGEGRDVDADELLALGRAAQHAQQQRHAHSAAHWKADEPWDLLCAKLALDALEPGPLGYDEWLSVGMALVGAFGEQGQRLFDEWSSRSPKYDAHTTAYKAASFKGQGVKLGTLFALARELASWQMPVRAPEGPLREGRFDVHSSGDPGSPPAWLEDSSVRPSLAPARPKDASSQRVGDAFSDASHLVVDVVVEAQRGANHPSSAKAPEGASPPKEPEEEVQEPEPDVWPDSDLGLSKRLVARSGQRIRHNDEVGWLVYDAALGIWERSDAAASWLAAKSAEDLRTQVVLHQPFDLATERPAVRKLWEARWKFARSAENVGKINAALSLAGVHPSVQVKTAELDQRPWLFNVKDGTLNLRRGVLEAHNPSHLLTQSSPVAYDEQAKCPSWERFLWDIMGGDARQKQALEQEQQALQDGKEGSQDGHRTSELVSYLQRLVGYCMTGSTKEQAFVVLHGSGANGKSTFLNILKLILGSYQAAAQFATFTATATETIRNDLAALRSVRLVSAAEPDEGVRLAEGIVKQLTGGDPITARHLYKDYFTYIPQFKILLSCNHLPVIKGTDHGIWRRVQLVPFLCRWRVKPDDPPELPDADPNLYDKLQAELPGILAWAVRGCLEWQEVGLLPPASVLAATNSYREDQDTFGAFLRDHTIVGAGCSVLSSVLYEAYQQWADKSGIKSPMSAVGFGRRIGAIPGVSSVARNSKRYWSGLGLLSASSDPEP